MSQSEQIKAITEKLQQGIEDLFNSDNYKEYLKTMSRFTSYSLNNTLLIAMQKPGATTVAGYTTWRQVNRQVVKGAKAIKIIAPCIYKKSTDDDITDMRGKSILDIGDSSGTEKVLVGFRVVNVFDYSQTEGEPLPRLTHRLDGSVDGYADLMDALTQFSPVPIEFKKIEGSAKGYYHLTDKNIVIDKGMSQVMNLKTAIHEVCHAMLHDRDNGLEKDALPDKETKEVQAESVAFTVCQYYGIDTSDYSFGYITGWSSGKELKELRTGLDVIRQTAQTIINGVDQKLDAIRHSRNMDGAGLSGSVIDIQSVSRPVHNRALRH